MYPSLSFNTYQHLSFLFFPLPRAFFPLEYFKVNFRYHIMLLVFYFSMYRRTFYFLTWIEYILHLTKLIPWYLIFCLFLSFSSCLQNVFYSWFVQIRIQIRSMHCIWLIGLSLAGRYHYHPVFGMPFICQWYWIILWFLIV